MNQGGSPAWIHTLNVECSDDPAAHGGLIKLRMLQALESDGIAGMVARYHALKAGHPTEAFGPLLIGEVAWRLFRGGQEEVGFRLFELDHAEHPQRFVAIENLAWGSDLTGDHERAIRLAERWGAGNPDHESGRRLLSDLREG